MRLRIGFLVLLSALPLATNATASKAVVASPVEMIDVEPVWAGHSVGFCLLTHPPYQFVAYYDAQRQMTVAQRRLGESKWTFVKLPSHLGWDSHNYVTMAIDREEQLHVAGNMHCQPLVYFTSTEPLDAQSLRQVPEMVGPDRERRVTYPLFLHGPQRQLIFRYRDGSSGNGDDIYNVYEEASRGWTRLIDQPLVSGQGRMNAYCTPPTLGPDGLYHLVWVWRDTPDCATNHDLSYARSRDLRHWTTAAGEPLALPITASSGTVVDAVPPGGGLINGGHRLGFDVHKRPVIAYHKYDEQGNSQVFAARFQNGAWQRVQVSDWSGYRWEFSGGGSIPFEVGLGSVVTDDDGLLCISCRYGRGRDAWRLSADSLKPAEGRPSTSSEPSVLSKASRRAPVSQSTASPSSSLEMAPPEFPGLQLRTADDRGQPADADHGFRLQWYTLGPNRDRPRSEPLPPPTMLRVVKYGR